MTLPIVKVVMGPTGSGSVIVDGVDMSNVISEIVITCKAQEPVKIQLTLCPSIIDAVLAESELDISRPVILRTVHKE